MDLNLSHVRQTFLLEHLADRRGIVDPADVVSNVIVCSADTEDNWLEPELADIKEEFSETSLEFWI